MMENKLRKKFLSLIYGSCFYTKGRIILQDKEIPLELQRELFSLRTKDGNEIILLKSSDLSKELERLLENLLSKIKDALIVFPGQGGEEVRKLSQIYKRYNWTKVFAKRHWTPGTNPWAEVGEISIKYSLSSKTKNVLVLDDVISSGQTLQKVHEINSEKFPNATWFGGSWISQMPRMKAVSGIDGYQKIITGIIVWGPLGKVPINSIRSLMNNTEMVRVYAEKHFQNPKEFLDWLSTIKEKEKQV